MHSSERVIYSLVCRPPLRALGLPRESSWMRSLFVVPSCCPGLLLHRSHLVLELAASISWRACGLNGFPPLIARAHANRLDWCSDRWLMFSGKKTNVSLAHVVFQRYGGSKSINTIGSVVLMIAVIIGPGVVLLPGSFATAGIIPSVIASAVVWALGTISGSMMCEAIGALPGNATFKNRIEYLTGTKFYVGKPVYRIAVAAFYMSFFLTILFYVVQSSLLIDAMVAEVSGETCGFRLNDQVFVCHQSPILPNRDFCGAFVTKAMCLSDAALGCNWIEQPTAILANPTSVGCFPDTTTLWGRSVPLIITYGLLVVVVFCVPLTFNTLEDNVPIQFASVVMTYVIFSIWLYGCAQHIILSWPEYRFSENIVWVGDWSSIATMIGTVLFNSGIAHLLPGWLSEKHRGVSINFTLWTAGGVTLIANLVIGLVGAVSYGHYFRSAERADILAALVSPKFLSHATHTVVVTATYSYPFIVLMPSIPLCGVMLKYSLTQGGMTVRQAQFFAVTVPFLVAIPFLSYYSRLATLISWASLGALSVADVFIPLWLFRKVIRRRAAEGDSEPPVLSLQGSFSYSAVEAHEIAVSPNVVFAEELSSIIEKMPPMELPPLESLPLRQSQTPSYGSPRVKSPSPPASPQLPHRAPAVHRALPLIANDLVAQARWCGVLFFISSVVIVVSGIGLVYPV